MARALVQANESSITPERFLIHYRLIRAAKRAHEETSSALQTAHRKAKSDGVDLDALRDVIRLSKLDPDAAMERLRKMRAYGKWTGLPIGTQLDMFAEVALADEPSEAAAAELREFDAEEAGFDAGKAGKHRVDDNPHPAGTPHYAAFDRGYLRGQRMIADKLGENARPASTRRTRRSSAAEPVREPALVQ